MTEAKFILVPSDKIQFNERCATVLSASHRSDLIRNYIIRLDPAVQSGFSSTQIQRDQCKLKVEKIKNLSSLNTDVALTNPGNITGTKSQGQSTETMTIQTLKDFELAFNTSIIKGECRVVTSTRYEVKLEVRKDAKSFLPPTPPGTTVLLTNPTPPAPQETMKLKTTLELSAGQRIELGSVIKNLKNDSSQVGFSNGVDMKQEDSSQEEKLFLSIE